MKKMYLLEGKRWLKKLGKEGFTWEREGYLLGSGVSMFEEIMDKKSSSAYIIDIEKKTVIFFPIEVYAPNSPVSDANMFQYYLSQCGDWDDLIKDIEDCKNKNKGE